MTPHELASKTLIPEIRALIAISLVERGLSQLQVSRLLGVSQAMVNKYLAHGRSEYYRRLEGIGLSRSDIDSIVSALVIPLLRGDTRSYMIHFVSAINRILASGKLCSYHRRVNPLIPGDCTVCMLVFSRAPSDPFLLEFTVYLDKLLSIEGIHRLVPEVGMNVVYCPPDAGGPRDCIGVLGRIVRVKERAVAVGKPRRGGSRHVSRVLWAVMRVDPGKRVCASARYTPGLLEKLEELGLEIAHTGPHASPGDFMGDLESYLSGMKRGRVDAIADRGGQGLEPIIYILAESMEALVSLVNRVLGG